MSRYVKRLFALVSIALAVTALLVVQLDKHASAQDSRCSTFTETRQTLCGRFLDYWTANGGLEQFGYPISDVLQEESETNGTSYQVQYFERARFEQHPESRPPDDVQLSLLGVLAYQDRYGPVGGPEQRPSSVNPRLFPETGKVLGGTFRGYWETHGGLASSGYPISNEFSEISLLNGQAYTVQYFERAVFEFHPENTGTHFEVLLVQLGRARYLANYGSLKLPAPSSDDLLQLYPQGSDTYLAWAEVKESYSPWSNPRRNRKIVGIYSLNLISGQVKLETDAPNLGPTFTLSGSTIFWSEADPSCGTGLNTCTVTYKGRNLKTGQFVVNVSVASAGGILSFAGYGQNIVSLRVTESGSQVVLHGPAQTEPTILDSIPNDGSMTMSRSFQQPKIGSRYVVWSDQIYIQNASGQAYNIKVYDMHKREVRYVESGILINDHQLVLNLSDSLLTWADPAVHYLNLDTGSQGFVTDRDNPYGLSQRGDRLVWDAFNRSGVTIWGSRFSTPAALSLVSNYTGDGHPTLAGNYIVWSQSHRLSAMLLSRAFKPNKAQPSPTPPNTSTITRFLANNVEEPPVGGGQYLFWTSRGTSTRIYEYDLTENRQMLLYESLGYKTGLASDGKSLVWVEMALGGRYSIRRYDLATRKVDTIVESGPYGETFGAYDSKFTYGVALAIDGDNLYYRRVAPENRGLWQRNLTTGTEQLVSDAGYYPVAADGNMVWSREQTVEGSTDIADDVLYLRRVSNPLENEIITYVRAGSGLSYSLSGDNLVWSDGSSVYRYYLPGHGISGPPPDPEPGRHIAALPLVTGNTLIWTDEHQNGSGYDWEIKTYDFNTQQRTTVVANLGTEGRVAQPLRAWATVGGRAVAYTVGFGDAAAAHDLFLTDLSTTSGP